jgi:hypothetical protein
VSTAASLVSSGTKKLEVVGAEAKTPRAEIDASTTILS